MWECRLERLNDMIPVYKPYFPKGSLKYAHDALDSTWVSSKGEYLDIVQERLQDLLGVKHVVLTNNGTSAAHLAARCLFRELKIDPYENDHFSYAGVLAPNNVYVAAWNSMLFDKAAYMAIADVDKETWNVNIEHMELELDMSEKIFGEEYSAVLIVHNLGNIINVPKLKRKYPNIVFIEDNCEGLFGKYEGKYSGTESLASSISFFGNKNITCGEGGALLTNSDDLYEFTDCLHCQGQSSTKFVHKELGYNYRMTNVEAAILLGQLDVLDEILERKEFVFSKYKELFAPFPNVKLQKIEPDTEPANWMFGIRIVGNPGYDHVDKFFSQNYYSIETRPFFYPGAKHRHLIEHEDIRFLGTEENVSDLLSREVVVLPSYPELTTEEIMFVVNGIDDYIQQYIT